MPKYRATVHVSGLSGDDPTAVRSALDDQLKKSGIENCRIVVEAEVRTRPIEPQPATHHPDSTWRRQANAGGLLLVAAVVWAVWFFWWMFSVTGD